MCTSWSRILVPKSFLSSRGGAKARRDCLLLIVVEAGESYLVRVRSQTLKTNRLEIGPTRISGRTIRS